MNKPFLSRRYFYTTVIREYLWPFVRQTCWPNTNLAIISHFCFWTKGTNSIGLVMHPSTLNFVLLGHKHKRASPRINSSCHANIWAKECNIESSLRSKIMHWIIWAETFVRWQLTNNFVSCKITIVK